MGNRFSYWIQIVARAKRSLIFFLQGSGHERTAVSEKKELLILITKNLSGGDLENKGLMGADIENKRVSLSEQHPAIDIHRSKNLPDLENKGLMSAYLESKGLINIDIDNK